jgi:2'-5' RNA ligase
MRLFLAVFPPPETQALAHALIEQLRARATACPG